MISKNYKFEKKWRKRKVKEYPKGIYVKFKPEEVEILHNRMQEAGVQNMSACMEQFSKFYWRNGSKVCGSNGLG